MSKALRNQAILWSIRAAQSSSLVPTGCRRAPGRRGVRVPYTGLNDVKPAMSEEATRNAREVATKFAEDSRSTLGKIRRASQGQVSIEARDTSTPQIKKLRVVSTVEYYLSD